MYRTVVVILIQHQIIVTNLLRNIKELEGRINNLILGVKGSVDMQSWLIFKSNLFYFFLFPPVLCLLLWPLILVSSFSTSSFLFSGCCRLIQGLWSV